MLGLIIADVAVVFILEIKSQVGKGIYEAKAELIEIEYADRARYLEEEVTQLTHKLKMTEAKRGREALAKSESSTLILGQMEILVRYEQEALNSLSEIMKTKSSGFPSIRQICFMMPTEIS